MQAILCAKQRGDSMSQLRQAHSEFIQKYPKLFEKLQENPVDTVQLEYIIDMFENVQYGRNTFESASVAVGQKMFDQYVKPNLPPPSD